MSLPASLAAMYESLRAEVVNGRARPDGIGAVIYHGLVHGMTLLVGSMRTGTGTPSPSSSSIVISRNPELLHVLANMVLQTQSEVMHVY
jgi:hypothetical protein